MYKKSKRKNRLIFLFVGIISLIVSCVVINRNFNLPDSFIRDGILFIDNFITSPFNNKSNNICLDDDSVINNYKNEILELKRENEELKETLKINKSLGDKKFINASVTGRSLDYWNSKLLIDKGINDDISDDMAVISNGVLIGITDDVSHFNSYVRLLTDFKYYSSISVKVIVGDEAYYGLLSGYDNSTKLFSVTGVVENKDIPIGSMVVTTGLGNNYPSGLVVGYVDSITTDNFDLAKVINVSSGINFDDISIVSVVKREDK